MEKKGIKDYAWKVRLALVGPCDYIREDGSIN